MKRCELRVLSFELRVLSFELRVLSFEFRVVENSQFSIFNSQFRTGSLLQAGFLGPATGTSTTVVAHPQGCAYNKPRFPAADMYPGTEMETETETDAGAVCRRRQLVSSYMADPRADN